MCDWGAIRRSILRRDQWRCQICGGHASDVDHIVELVDGGSFYEPSNLRALCDNCHKAKTAQARKLRREGVGISPKTASPQGNPRWTVGGYAVTYTPSGLWICNCPDFIDRALEQSENCAHIEAILAAIEAGQETPVL